jgi:deoxyribonuclease V
MVARIATSQFMSGLEMSDWPRTIAEARQVQIELASQVVTRDRLGKVKFVAGADVGFEKQGEITKAAVVVLRYPGLELIEKAVVRRKTGFPYIPGYLSFREAPAVLAAIQRLKQKPDLLLCDGQGIAHPKRFGLACHIGLLSDLPTIGVAKTRLIGEYREPGVEKGCQSTLWDNGEIIGSVLRTRKNVRPVFVSIGHKICLETAAHYVLSCTTRYRLPETTRWAHRLASG